MSGASVQLEPLSMWHRWKTRAGGRPAESVARSATYYDFIDGLRALAALAIVAFHVAPLRVPGGFVGVDIFFVISGFLITGQIFSALDRGEFSLIDFFARRIRRLYPALLVMVVVTTIFASMLLLPYELEDYAWSVLSSLAYVSNIDFLLQTGYFGSDVDTIPLLHTWSLSVEEQFYLAFPLICLLLAGLARRGRIVGLLLVVAVSLAASELLLAEEYTSAAFYLSPFRAWEFAIGGLVAIAPVPKLRRWLREGLTLACLALLLSSPLWMSPTFRFPGIGALPIVLATATLIALSRDENGLAKQLLSLSPLRAVGRASYSIYLWHWPIVAFYIIAINQAPEMTDRLIMLGLSLGVGALSYLFIEKPFLSRNRKGSPRRVALGALAASSVVAVMAVGLLVNNGLPQRFTGPQLSYAGYIDGDEADEDYAGTCFLYESYMRFSTTFPKDSCLRIDPGMTNVLLVGDSYASHLVGALRRQFPEVNFAQANASGCLPLLETSGAGNCVRMMDYVLAPEVLSGGFDAVILAARWRDESIDEAAETVRYIEDLGLDVYVVGPTIEYRLPLPRLLAFKSDDDGTIPSLRRYQLYEEIKRRDEVLRNAVVQEDADFLSIFSALCGPTRCTKTTPDGVPVSYDYGHFTAAGADLVVDGLVRQGLLADLEPEYNSVLETRFREGPGASTGS